MPATIGSVNTAPTIPACAAAWDDYLRELLGSDRTFTVTGLIPAVPSAPVPLVTAINVSPLFPPTMGLEPPIPKVPSALDMVADNIGSNVILTWLQATIPGTSAVVITPALGLLSVYIKALNLAGQLTTTAQLDAAIHLWLTSVLITYTVTTATFSAVFL